MRRRCFREGRANYPTVREFYVRGRLRARAETFHLRCCVHELKNHRGATVKDLLTYTVRGLQLSTLKDNTAEDILAHVFECGFFAPPGKPEYTNLPALLLGLIVERVSKETLNALSQRIFFDPLHMTRTTFSPSFAPSFAISFGGRSKASEGRPSDVERCVPTEII